MRVRVSGRSTSLALAGFFFGSSSARVGASGSMMTRHLVRVRVRARVGVGVRVRVRARVRVP